MSNPERYEWGNADTTAIGCIKSSCCWQMTPPPNSYHAIGVVTDSPTIEGTNKTTDGSITDPTTTSTIADEPTDSLITEILNLNPSCVITTFERED